MNTAQQAYNQLLENMGRVILGKDDVIRLAVITLLARGHLLIEDVPGVGKTSLAHALAQSLDLQFRRIQFTNDLLPSDITGISIFDQKKGEFEFKPGPLFTNILLADEINRSTPRTQSALLEAMNEQQVSVDTTTYPLENPFLVIATQNPIESHGAHPLPESQLDRFMMYIQMGYPSLEDERKLLSTVSSGENGGSLKPVLGKEEVIRLQQEVLEVNIEPVLIDYILSIVNATRQSKHLRLGLSPRGGLIFRQAARACALIEGRNYCLPDDIKQMALPVLCHRVIPENHRGSNHRRFADTAAIINDIIENLEVPV